MTDRETETGGVQSPLPRQDAPEDSAAGAAPDADRLNDAPAPGTTATGGGDRADDAVEDPGETAGDDATLPGANVARVRGEDSAAGA
jgi:hypothetical protein